MDRKSIRLNNRIGAGVKAKALSASAIDDLLREMSSILGGTESRSMWWRIAQIHTVLADEYGRRNGWLHSERSFFAGQLARGSNCWRESDLDEELGHVLDHLFHYRESHDPQRPVAIVSHPYDWGDKREAADALCRKHGLTCRVEDSFPSWWSPGLTTMIVFTRGSH
jgi:hypothetical protein